MKVEPTVVLNLYSEEETVKSVPVLPFDSKCTKSSASESRFAEAERPNRTCDKAKLHSVTPMGLEKSVKL